MSTLYVVATPIGNLEDITLRALRILGEVDLILCEDTRMTKKLLLKYNIETRTESYHAHSTDTKELHIIKLLNEGKNIALVSDAGTPTISDPGSHLVALIRKELKENINIVTVPGPSAAIAALSIGGMPASEFLFLGFLPHKKGRETLFNEVAESKRTVVFYESPHRIMKALGSLMERLSDDQMVVIAREITKMHEEVVRGSAKEVYAHFETHPDTVKGEFVVIVEGVR